MATVDQIKALIKAHNEQDNEKFKTIALQIAAYEARLGHSNNARALKVLIDKGSSVSLVMKYNHPNSLLIIITTTERLSYIICSH